MTKWKIVADSGCDYKELANLAPDTLFQSVPLSIQIEGTDYLDDTNLDIDYMMNAMYGSSKAQPQPVPVRKPMLQPMKGLKISLWST